MQLNMYDCTLQFPTKSEKHLQSPVTGGKTVNQETAVLCRFNFLSYKNLASFVHLQIQQMQKCDNYFPSCLIWNICHFLAK